MRVILYLSVIFSLFVGGASYALDFEITEVIEVGPAGGGPMYRPVRWSPDGSMIAYFRGHTLMVADTLGSSREIITIDYQGRDFEWVNDSEIVFAQRPVKAQDGKTFRLSSVTLSGVETVLEEESTSRFGRPAFHGPSITPSGVVYYTRIQDSDSTITILSRTGAGGMVSPSGHYMLKKIGPNLAKVSLDKQETEVIIENRWGGAVASSDFRYVAVDGAAGEILLHNLNQGTVDTVSALAPSQPSGIYCGTVTCDFNRVYQLIAYYTTCDSHYDQVGNYINFYDLADKRGHLVSPLVTSEGEKWPAFSPNGRFLSFLASGLGVCIARVEVTQ